MDNSKPLWQWSACDLAAAIRNRDVSCEEAVASSVTRMQEVNPHLNAVVIELPEQALEQAKRADNLAQNGGALGPLHGVPVTVKVNTDLKGYPNSNGVPALAGNIAPDDAPVVANLKKAGAIVVGITNTPEFSFRIMTENPLYGLTRNPWHDDFTCGGSSGGAASATAAGITPIAQGNGIGGSLRLPAFCCGVSTVRPTLGRVPSYNPSQMDERSLSAQLFSVQGPIAREVKDVRLALSVMAQGDPRDPWWVPAPLEGPKMERPIKVAVSKAPAGLTPEPGILAGIEKAALYLSDAGYDVVDVEAPFSEELSELWLSLIMSEMKEMQDAIIRQASSQDMLTFIDSLYGHTRLLDHNGYMRGLMRRTTLLREWLMFLDQYPLVLSPLSLKTSYRVNEDLEGFEKAGVLLKSLYTQFSINTLGLPAAVAPMGLENGVPFGVQLVGQRYREDICLDAAEVIEKKVGILSEQLW